MGLVVAPGDRAVLGDHLDGVEEAPAAVQVAPALVVDTARGEVIRNLDAKREIAGRPQAPPELRHT